MIPFNSPCLYDDKNLTVMKKYAVIFKTFRDLPVPKEYIDINLKLQADVKAIDGFLGVESIGNDQGYGLSISYWNSLDSIKEWKAKALHLEAQKLGSQKFYKYYKVEVCEVINEYSGGYEPKTNEIFS